MITVDDRCTMASCEDTTGIYRMIGKCRNCGQENILVLFTAGHDSRAVDCPRCGGHQCVQPSRLATPDEIPAA